jgi:quinone-modifying oxidoreductase subunit QmoC
MSERYRNNFLKEIEEQAEMGDWVKMCMQCGLCSGSCPKHFQAGWDHPPQEIFMMIRAGKRDEVLDPQIPCGCAPPATAAMSAARAKCL